MEPPPPSMFAPPDAVEGSNEDLRVGLFRASLLRVILGTFLLGFFWAAYSWIIVFIFLSITMGAVGVTHFASLESLYHSQCCCSPRPAVVFMYYSSIINIPLSIISVLSSVFGAFDSTGMTRIFSVVSLGLCIVMCVTECYFLIRCKRLRERLEYDSNVGMNGNQVAPEVVLVAYPNYPPPSAGGFSDDSDGGGGYWAQPVGQVVYGLPIQQQLHIQSGPSLVADDGRNCPPTPVAEEPPAFVHNVNALGYLPR